MENRTYFIESKIGKAVIVSEREFNEFIELFELLHPDYCVKTKDFRGHLFTDYYVNDERYCFTID